MRLDSKRYEIWRNGGIEKLEGDLRKKKERFCMRDRERKDYGKSGFTIFLSQN